MNFLTLTLLSDNQPVLINRDHITGVHPKSVTKEAGTVINMVAGYYTVRESFEEVARLLDREMPIDNDFLWNALKEHYGHRVSIAVYGNPDYPACICLEDEDTDSVILDAELYTLAARTDV